MTQEDLELFFEYNNLVEIQEDEGKIYLILDINNFKELYVLIGQYLIDNDIYLKPISENLFSIDITDILTFYEIRITQ